MRAKDIMSAPVITASPSTSLKRVAQLLLIHDISAVPIVNEVGGLIGIVSENDLLSMESVEDPRLHIFLKRRSRRRLPSKASDVMTTVVFTVTENEDVASVARLMHAMHVKRVPVLASGRVTGIISRRDILKIFARSDATILAELQQSLDDQAMVLGRFKAMVANGIVVLSGPPDPSAQNLAETLVRGVPGVVAVRFEDAA